MKKTRSELKREAILQAAREAFREFGAQSTSMDKIAAMAQVSKRTVYNHFISKEQLVMTLMAELWQVTNHLIEPAQLAFEPLDKQLEYLLLSEIEILTSREYLDLARVVLSYYLYRPQELEMHTLQMANNETPLLRWLKQQTDKEQLWIPDVELANKQLHSLVKGQSFWPQLFGSPLHLTSEKKRLIAQQCVQFFLSHYGVKK
ncbi:TetR/AcrR family transcriptional regulator [Vibrio cincinnatiensis]|uniref:TetR/AcrR family transcriptional regulator n=1 Tax=Vibrio cincinnatiensis TaxID=675 RepID=UPI001EDE1E51|nr:TetR/AcrR family transcriptional regulator [Vibrio cincinnatiensis]MCG3728640.1 TetR/AcrR family transcriptional regulator [Vibrio cincinnatiensis]